MDKDKRKVQEFKFREGLEPQATSNFWYDITDGGYIHFEDLLENPKQARELEQALALIERFKEAAYEKEIIYDL